MSNGTFILCSILYVDSFIRPPVFFLQSSISSYFFYEKKAVSHFKKPVLNFKKRISHFKNGYHNSKTDITIQKASITFEINGITFKETYFVPEKILKTWELFVWLDI